MLSFSIIDNGKRFDPTVRAEVDTTLSAEERSIGGLGIHLVRQLMDTINYEYVDDNNILTLSKKIKVNNG
ncbi:MAG: ATP-binding protein [Bacteroidaceae bacterium]|nr:ATP-binding protein [Bacteroidaceae bacterium]